MAELFDVALSANDKAFTKDELKAAVADCDVFVPTVTDQIDAEVLAAASERLKLIANFGDGVDGEERDLMEDLSGFAIDADQREFLAVEGGGGVLDQRHAFLEQRLPGEFGACPVGRQHELLRSCRLLQAPETPLRVQLGHGLDVPTATAPPPQALLTSSSFEPKESAGSAA